MPQVSPPGSCSRRGKVTEKPNAMLYGLIRVAPTVQRLCCGSPYAFFSVEHTCANTMDGPSALKANPLAYSGLPLSWVVDSVAPPDGVTVAKRRWCRLS
jgi:hypothetical protein